MLRILTVLCLLAGAAIPGFALTDDADTDTRAARIEALEAQIQGQKALLEEQEELLAALRAEIDAPIGAAPPAKPQPIESRSDPATSAAPAANPRSDDLEARIAALEQQVERQQALIAEQQKLLDEMQPAVDKWRKLSLTEQQALDRLDVASSSGEKVSESSLVLNGFVNLDMIQDFKRVEPAYNATLRPTTIPAVPGQYGADGEFIFSVKQTKLGLVGESPSRVGTVSYWIEFDLFGLGSRAGETSLQLRHAWAEVAGVGFGWTWSNFMDIDTWPNVVDWWGPSGMVLNRNPQLRYTWHFEDESLFAVALENANASRTIGVFGELSPELEDQVKAVSRIPDLTARYRSQHDWGHVQIAGVLRQLSFESLDTPNNEPKGDELGWGLNLTGVVGTFGKDKIKAGVTYGEGIATFINDGGGSNLAPAVGGGAEAVPSLSYTLYYDHFWTDSLSSAIGISGNEQDYTPLQSGIEIDNVTYASTNLLWAPSPSFWTGLEFLYGERVDIDGSGGDDYRLQFQLRYSFSNELF